MLKILYIAEIVGTTGVYCVKNILPDLKEELHPDFIIANGDGATGGFGIGKNHSVYLHKLGIDILTGGECIYYKKDMVPHIAKVSYILRAANYPYGNPGRGWTIKQVGQHKLGVISVLGISGFTKTHLTNPFLFLPDLVAKIKKETPHVLIDFHAATTAEKVSLFHHLDGTVSAVIGSHGKVATADEEIKPGGTAVITDAGRTGSRDSIGGLDPQIELGKFLTQVYERSKIAWAMPQLQGIVIELDAEGQAVSIERITRDCPEEEYDGDRNDNQHRA